MPLVLVWPKDVPHLYGDVVIRGMHVLQPRRTIIHQPFETRFAHAVYESMSATMFKRRPMRHAFFRGWRYAVVRNEKDMYAVEARVTEDKGRYDIVAGDNPASQRLLAFIKSADCCLKGRGNSYEPRLLRLPDQCLEIMWLKPERAASLFVPLDNTRVGLMQGHAYGFAAFRQALNNFRPGKEQ